MYTVSREVASEQEIKTNVIASALAVTSLSVELRGVGGAGGVGNTGGAGGFAGGTLSVTPGEVLKIVVGEGAFANGEAYGGKGAHPHPAAAAAPL